MDLFAGEPAKVWVVKWGKWSSISQNLFILSIYLVIFKNGKEHFLCIPFEGS